MTIQKLYLELTDRCNLDCSICYRKSWNSPPTDLGMSSLVHLTAEMNKQNTIKEIVIGGIGEPTFSPIFQEAIQMLKDYHLTLTTNGTLLYGELLDMVIKHVDVVTVSIDGLEERFESIRGVPLEKVVHHLTNLRQSKKQLSKSTPILQLQFVASEDNMDDIFRVIDLAAALNAQSVIISNLLPQCQENAVKILYTRYENPRMKALFHQIRNYSFKKGIQLLLPNYELKTERRCNFIEQDAVFVCASGDVVPCYRLSHPYQEYVFGREKQVGRHSFGNIQNHSLYEIWHQKSYADFRQTIYHNLYPSCIDCDLVEGCDMVRNTEADCYGVNPSCGDCLWTRKFVMCP
ncbi:tungsten cofactor oxidoreductase radical SAM maturase [Anaerosolibacter carboniphilus]|uniref:Tungsten cofactor oxidoreductase radical SAM maturase n=2 Tax=Anaerosolibacter carboniphilus TaxID=1417629 RepID=A0A841KPX0_9FIRM|nr:tungsten cofactor oxidoreductase radical SAM maturase [Anaerosolibacter carboniphilus]